MACGCSKSKSTSTVNSTVKKIDTSAAQKKVAQSLPLITVNPSTIPASNRISKRQK
jgi:hypothetical protein